MGKPFASSADLADKEQTLEILADEGEDFLVCALRAFTPSP